jgi:hypothetical protein
MSENHPGIGGFFARCRLAYQDNDTGQMLQCDAKFDDPAEFEQHMARIHRRTKPKTPKATMWRRPPRTRQRYEPKEHGVGAWITFAERRDGSIVLRHGQVWSLGPPGIGNSLWVVPDDGGDAVVVKISKRPVLTSQTVLEVVPGHEMHRRNLRRAENLRGFARLFPVVVETRWEYTWSSSKRLAEYWCWHVDPTCPDAVGKPAPSRKFQPYRVTQVILDLISGRINASTTRFCRFCFWLDNIDDTEP